MNNREIIVRIIQPAEKPQVPQRQHLIYTPKANHLMNTIINVVGLAALVTLVLFIFGNFFHFGFALQDIFVLAGIPIAVGIVATYAIL